MLRVIEQQFQLVLDDGIAAYYRRHDANVTLNVEELQREFMLASLKWAVRNRMRNGSRFRPSSRSSSCSGDEIEEDFDE